MQEIMKNVSNHMKRYQTEHNLSIEGLAMALGIGKQSALKYLHGEGNPNLSTLDLMAGRMGISVGDLVSSVESLEDKRKEIFSLLASIKQEVGV